MKKVQPSMKMVSLGLWILCYSTLANAQLVKSPLGHETDFRHLRQSKSKYIDKTWFAWKLITQESEKHFFLSRPRQFGKTLFLSTLKEIFLSDHLDDIFKGTQIERLEYDWRKYAILYLDFSTLPFDSSAQFNTALMAHLSELGGAQLAGFTVHNKLHNLIMNLQTGKETVVVLIDEYDYQLVNCEPDQVKPISQILQNMYGNFKIDLQYIRFTFVTGVSGYRLASLTANADYLQDLTLNPNYEEILGFTKKELEDNLQEYINEVAERRKISVDKVEQEISQWYNGYCFSGNNSHILNPVSVKGYLFNAWPARYWCATAALGSLNEYLKRFLDPVKEGKNVSHQDLTAIGQLGNDAIKTEGFMYQVGYLTVDKHHKGAKKPYELRFANLEVKDSYKEAVRENFVLDKVNETLAFTKKQILVYITYRKPDMENFIKLMNIWMAKNPYRDENRNGFKLYFSSYCQEIGLRMEDIEEGGLLAITQFNAIVFEFSESKTAMRGKDQVLMSLPAVKTKVDILLVWINYSTDPYYYPIRSCSFQLFDQNKNARGGMTNVPLRGHGYKRVCLNRMVLINLHPGNRFLLASTTTATIIIPSPKHQEIEREDVMDDWLPITVLLRTLHV